MPESRPTTQKGWDNLIAVRDAMIYECSNSARVIHRVLAEAGRNMSYKTVAKYIGIIRSERQAWRDGLAKDVYESVIWDECIAINREIKRAELDLDKCKPGMQKASMMQALTQHRMRREYVMSKLALLPRLVELEHAKHQAPNPGIITVK